MSQQTARIQITDLERYCRRELLLIFGMILLGTAGLGLWAIFNF